ncbi:MAG: NAD(P)H-binding protein [Bacteroidota bacterium]
MKIAVTGSLGHISKPLAIQLVKQGHSVVVISSKADKKKDIEAIGATAAIGTMTDPEFLANTFAGADVVYLMEAVGAHRFFDKDLDMNGEIAKIANSYKIAVEKSGVKKVIHLSSIGAHADKGVGMLSFHHTAEQIFNQLPEDVSIKFMRPVGFYYNMLAFIPTIKKTGTIIQNYGGDQREPWVAPVDIASVIAEEIEKPFKGRTVRYIASEELSPNEVAKIIGETIGQPDLKWVAIPDEQILNNLLSVGMNPQAAKGLTDMNASRRNGVLYEDYNRNRPVLSKTKLKDYMKEFKSVYDSGQNQNH